MKEISRCLRALLKKNRGITLLEIMISVSILGICMAYIAYDASFSNKTIKEMNEEDKMLYAAQESIERYKTGLISNSVNGCSIEVNDSEEDDNLTTSLKKVIVTVHPSNTRFGLQDMVFVTYIFSETEDVPSEPTNLTAAPSLENITLNWTRAINADSYKVKRREEGQTNYTTIASGITEDAYTDTSVEAGTRYYYIVWATNDNGDGPESNEANAIIIINTSGLEPVEDAYVDGRYTWDNYGQDASLIAQNGNWKQQYKSYLKFNLSSVQGTIISAKLRIYGSAGSSINSVTSGVTDDSWTENGITWSNAPDAGSSLGTLSFNTTNKYVELDVTSYCKTELAGNQLAGFLFTAPNGTKITAVSRHPSSNRPQLVITWTPATAPTVPQNLTAEPGDTKATLNWSTVIGAEAYNVKRSEISGGPYTTLAEVSSTSYIDSAVTNGTTYYYVVSAVNSTGEGNNSNEASTTPDKLVTITANPTADTYIRDGVYSGNNYGSNAKLEVKNAVVGSDERRLSYLKFDLSGFEGEVISARLRIYGSNMDDSTSVSLGLNHVEDEDWEENTMTLSNAPELAEELGSIKVDNTQSYKEINVTDFIKSVMSGTKIASIAYVGKDTSKLLSFNSKESITNKPELVILKTLPKPIAPQGLKALPDNAKVTLSWTQALEVDSYTIKRSTTDGGPYSVLASGITSSSYIDSSVTNGTEYYYVVSAVNASGESSNSDQVSATPSTSVTITLNPVADARTESYNPSTNYGTNTVLGVTNDGVNNKKTYLRFSLAGYTHNTPIQTKLRLYGKTDGSTISINAYKVSNTTWIESGSGSITSSNAPVLETQVGSVAVGSTQQYYEIDVSDYIAQQMNTASLISIGVNIEQTLATAATFNSKEATSNKPELVVKMLEGIPKIPQNLVGTGTSGKATLTWSAADGAVSYKVKTSTTLGGPYTTKASGITATTYSDTGLTNNTSYYYVVSAVNAKGESANSNEVCVIPSLGQTTRVLYAVADSYLRDGQYADTNYGGASIDVSYSYQSGGTREGYLMFDLSELSTIPVTAKLKISGRNITNTKTMTIEVYEGTDDTWGEYSITWNNSAITTGFPQTFYVNRNYTTSTVDVTTFARDKYQKNKKLSLPIDTSTTKGTASFSSRHGTDAPVLIVTY